MQDSFHLKIISPTEIIVDEQVPQVEIPGVEGDFGVLPGHSPLFSMVRPGVISVKLGNGTQRRFFAMSGYADVTPQSCTVISDHIQDLTAISVTAADEAWGAAKAALAQAQNPAEQAQAEKKLQAADALMAAVKAH